MIPEEVGKEDNSDDEKKIKNIKSSKSSNSDSDSDSDNDFEDIIILNQKSKEKEEEKLKTINNLIQNTLSSEKLLTKKEELFYKLQFIFLLLDCKDIFVFLLSLLSIFLSIALTNPDSLLFFDFLTIFTYSLIVAKAGTLSI